MIRLIKLISLIVLMISVVSSSSVYAQKHQIVRLREARGTYTLDFDKIYETVASLDVETAVTLPDGYTYALPRPGSIDFINAFVMQNTLYFTKTIDHSISTSIFCNVITPNGETRSLVFKIKGGSRLPVVYAIHFVKDGSSSREIESMKIRFENELNVSLARQKKKLNTSIYRSTMAKSYPVLLGEYRKSLKLEHKGAVVYLDGIISSQGDYYIYLQSNVRKDNCDVVKLIGYSAQRNSNIPTELVDVSENNDGNWSYVYRVPSQPVYKKTKVKLLFEIWSKKFTMHVTIS